MKRLLVILLLLLLTAALVLLASRAQSLQLAALPQHEPDISNGQRLFNAGGCASCHASVSETSKPPLLGGGLEMDTAFGLFRVPNISPHPSSGIGDWSMLGFVNAMHLGTSPDGQHYYPAFPYASYTRMRFEDLMDLKSYLDTLPLVEDVSADHSLKFPWNIRAGIGLWKFVNLDSSFIIPIDTDNALLERGRYLVEGPGHCGECHTARDWTGGLDKAQWLAGAPNPDGEGRVPNITPHQKGLADWDENDIEYYLESGFTPDFDTVGGSMVKVQENMARLSATDRAAIALYLKSIPALN
jgi:mono/diheme cytochrome c family protein